MENEVRIKGQIFALIVVIETLVVTIMWPLLERTYIFFGVCKNSDECLWPDYLFFISLISILIISFVVFIWLPYKKQEMEEFKKRNGRPSKRSNELEENNDFLWSITKNEKIKQYKISIDIHKSPNWENDGEIFLCVHNKSFFKKLWDLSVVVAGIYKIENGKSNIEIGETITLNETFHLRNRLAYTDLPFLKVSKEENKVFMSFKYRDEQNEETSQYEFLPGEYIVNLIVRKLVIFEGQKKSGVIPVRIKYNGSDKIEWKIDFLTMIDYGNGFSLPSASEIIIQ